MDTKPNQPFINGFEENESVNQSLITVLTSQPDTNVKGKVKQEFSCEFVRTVKEPEIRLDYNY